MQIERHQGLPGGRAVVGGALIALAALGVLIAYQRADAGPSDTVVVADATIGPGELIEADDLRLADVDLGDIGGASFTSIDDVVGRVALGPIGDGELVQAASVTDQRADATSHEVALQLPRGQIAVGRLKEGERVDVLVTAEAATRSVVRGARVVDIDAADDASLTSSREVTLVVQVPDGDAVAAVVHALRTGDVTVIRSTFAEATIDEPLTFDEAGSGDRDDTDDADP